MVAINPHGGQDMSIMQVDRAADRRPLLLPAGSRAAPEHLHQGSEDAEALDAAEQSVHADGRVSVADSERHRRAAAAARLRAHDAEAARDDVLRAPPSAKASRGDQPDPVLATWRFGLGTTGAWTSDLAPNWAADWMDWEKYRAFVKQLATEISRVEQKSDLQLRAFASGAHGRRHASRILRRRIRSSNSRRASAGRAARASTVPLQADRAAALSGRVPALGQRPLPSHGRRRRQRREREGAQRAGLRRIRRAVLAASICASAATRSC